MDALFVQDQDGENGICFPCPSKMVLLGLMVECNNIMLEVEGDGDGIYGMVVEVMVHHGQSLWIGVRHAAVDLGGWTVVDGRQR